MSASSSFVSPTLTPTQTQTPSTTSRQIETGYTSSTLATNATAVASPHPSCGILTDTLSLPSDGAACIISGQGTAPLNALRHCCSSPDGNTLNSSLVIFTYAGMVTPEQRCGLGCYVDPNQIDAHTWSQCMIKNLRVNDTINGVDVGRGNGYASSCNGFVPQKKGEAPPNDKTNAASSVSDRIWAVWAAVVGVGMVVGAVA